MIIEIATKHTSYIYLTHTHTVSLYIYYSDKRDTCRLVSNHSTAGQREEPIPYHIIS
jgi:hypothetical protein